MQLLWKILINKKTEVDSEDNVPRAIILVNADVGKEADVYSSIKQIQEVSEVHTSYGTYDIIAIIDADTTERLKAIITTRIRSIPSIRSTLSMPVVD